jgi:hypothetical protein
MHINWKVTTRFDPNSLEPSKHGIPIPSYGNYGGPNYTAGVEGGTTPEIPNPPAVDGLDTLFWQHDLVYQHLEDGTATAEDTFDADAQLIEAMFALAQTETDPEALLYEALGTLAIVGKILTTPGELSYLQGALPPQDLFLISVLAPQAALQNFETGLAETSGNDSRSLQGACHVFQNHFSDLLLA